uniref:piggyBac transposable element-derived protein 4-like isoform X2 n=1 Tax=Styela clava TaxID=7725 RepID=UPI001939B0B1|nr:piggyBac transposable element-derived protein 4-like isoform X2 [Styela clava]
MSCQDLQNLNCEDGLWLIQSDEFVPSSDSDNDNLTESDLSDEAEEIESDDLEWSEDEATSTPSGSPRFRNHRKQDEWETPPSAKKGRHSLLYSKRPVYNWEKSFKGRSIKQFGGQRGVTTRQLTQTSTPIDCFSQFFNSTVLQFIVDMTNLNAVRKIHGRSVDKNSQEKAWRAVDVEEMKAFIGLLIAMGIIRLPNLHMYWQKKNWVFDVPSFNKIMPRDRFIDLYTYLHFCDEALAHRSDDQKKDKLFKIRGLLSLVLPLFQSCYTPGRDIAIDETLIPFKGKISFRQTIKTKRARTGIKVWVLAESLTGYVSRLQIYTGRDPTAGKETGLATRVVKYLINPYEGLHHHLYVDNFYTSAELFEYLLSKGVYACGTSKCNAASFPKELIVTQAREIPRGTSDWRMCGQLLAQSWVDNRMVYFLSMIHKPEYDSNDDGENTVIRRGKRGRTSSFVKIPCPPLLKDYNKYMIGVDLSDQMRKYYNLTRRSKVWYRRVFSYILEVAVHNARVVFENLTGQRCEGVGFRMELVVALIGSLRAGRRPGVLTPASITRLHNAGSHFPIPGGRLKTCRVCSKKSRVSATTGKSTISRSSVKCSYCDVHLCVRENRSCFRDWHTKVEYWR